jgi:hypothetical protein
MATTLESNIDTNINNEKHNNELTKENAIILLNFYKIFKDLIIDLNECFNDKLGNIIENNKDYQNIINYCLPNYNNENDIDEYVESIDLEILNKDFITSLNNIYNYCKEKFPKRFFDIIYQNEDIFLNNSTKNQDNDEYSNIDTTFFPQIEFKALYYDDTSEKTKETLWKYLQLILFNIVTSIDNKDSFGANAQLFEAINSDEFKDKLQSTIRGMEDLFNFKKPNNDMSGSNFPDLSDLSGMNVNNIFSDISLNLPEMFESMKQGLNEDSSSNSSNPLPDSEEIFSHINNLINGKIGSLAKELAEETSKDLDIDLENANDVGDVFKKLFKNPSNLMNLVNNISKKIDTKMKDGSIKESELLEEASSIFKNMKNMPGMGNMEQLFKSMNMDQFMPKGGKFNNNAFQSMMDQNIKMSKMKERMRKKAEQNKNNGTTYSANYSENKQENKNINENPSNLNDLNSNLVSLMEQMQNLKKETASNNSFIDDIIKKQNLETSSTNKNNNEENKKRKSNNKKKVNKKK